MKERKIKRKTISLFFSVLLFLTFSIGVSNINIFASAETYIGAKDSEPNMLDNTAELEYDIAKISRKLFGNKPIKKSEFLYNFDDVADYVYIEYHNGGYAVFFKQTMELMEYSVNGKLDYANTISKKYYGGPGSYLLKYDNYFVDTISNQSFYVSLEKCKKHSDDIRKNLLSNCTVHSQKEIINYDYSLPYEDVKYETNEVIDRTGNGPELDTSSLIIIPETSGTYIPNYQYFLCDPTHGRNTSGTCGAVAAQLLLGYHNYYSDRRIIDNSYLNGGITNPNLNPNFCTDPMSMTSYTLGTRGFREDGSDDPNSYFSYVVSKIPANCTTKQLKNGISNILSERNQEISGTIDYYLKSKTGGWFFGNLAVNTSGIISEITSGRPTIILMQKSLGGSDHYVVAYGYCNYTYPGSTNYYEGFITHFGWSSGQINVWINSAWCYSYVSLKINHTHNYYTFGTIPGTDRNEYRCIICGHRTDAAINMLAHHRYEERLSTIPQNGYRYKDYYLTFETAGNKLFQTFGPQDTKLYLYDTEYNQLAYNDDNGYSTNALFSYSAESNTPYILRVMFFYSGTAGSIKIGITPADYAYSNYENIWHLNQSNVGTQWVSTLNTTKVLCFTPKISGTYRINTNSPDGIDTCLYLIDPTSIDACVYDDDSGGNLQALIFADLVSTKRYFLIVSAYDITHNCGTMNVSMNKIS